MTEDGDIPEDDGVLAAEYALGLLSDIERAEVEARLARDGALRAKVAFWQEHFVSLTDGVPEIPAPDSVWRRIERALPAAEPEMPAPHANRIGLWRSLAGLAAAAALAFAVLLFAGPGGFGPQDGEAPLFAGEIRAEDASLRLVVAYDAASGRLRLARAEGAVAAGRALELWAIPEGGAPVSLGTLPEDPRAEVDVPEALRPGFGEVTLAVSDEPEGGSPTGQPTGAVLAVGGITRL